MFILYSILTVTVLGTLLVAVEVRMYVIKKRKERPEQPYYEFINEFLVRDLKTNFNARIRTFTVAAGIIFYLAGSMWSNILYSQIGFAFLLIHLVFLGFYVNDVFNRKNSAE